ncbi:MAG: hypothetical protein GXO43_04230 [Crenarchaeota archaeon]|nr:hypothetical protein [Thermoproteota archaeon]
MDNYLSWREHQVDKTEYYDILYALYSLGADEYDPIHELCAGNGGLMRFLYRHGFHSIGGCDIRGDGEIIDVCDLNKGLPDNIRAKYFVFQHCLEHLDQEAAKKLLRQCMERGEAVIGILPGHHTRDPTHVVNHYDLEQVVDLVLASNAPYILVTLDMASYVHPENRDWLVIMSRKPFKLKRPWWFRIGYRFMRHMLGRLVR